MHADLVRPAGVNRDLRQGQLTAEVLGTDDARDRRAGAPHAIRIRRHLLPVVRIAPDRLVDPPPRHHFAPGEREVFLLDLALGELPGQFGVRLVVLRDDHQPRRAFVEPVHDARPFLAADPAEIVHVMQQRVHQRAARVSRRRVHHHPRRFVDHDQVVILIEDRQRQRFRLRRRVDQLGHVDGDLLCRFDRLVRLRRLPGDQHVAVLDQALDLRARQRQDGDEKAVDAQIVHIVGNRDGLNHAVLRARFGSGVIARER